MRDSMRFTHFNEEGQTKMVDVSEKPLTKREAMAIGSVHMRPETLKLIKNKQVSKGDVFEVARVAGIMAAKKTSEIIPMCHQLNLTHVGISLDIDEGKNKVTIKTTIKIAGQTGVEMEALVATTATALTIYDMCKAVDKEMVISDITLLEKRGGRSGEFRRD